MYGSIKMSWLSSNSTVATGNRSGEGLRKAEELGMGWFAGEVACRSL
jgi:hypothetical protein